ncbi:MAG TPA: hypothetical protein VMS12_05690 [Thermoanaerobaculia bacterium]|nr:hypothetical protein [Thermoanaerobaculia bacterium]
MPTYLIEVRHESTPDACVRALNALDRHGSHFVTHADFGCADGAHCGWLTVDVDSRDAAERIVPPEFRAMTRVVELRKFTREEIHVLMKQQQEVGVTARNAT